MSWFKPKLSVKQILSMARLHVRSKLPFFTLPVYRLVPVECDTVETMAVNHRCVLFYNPKYIEAHDVPWIAADFIHEASHILRDHHGRAMTLGVPPHHAFVSNACMDAELNDGHTSLIPIKNAVLPQHLHPPQPSHKLWEGYYRACRKHAQNLPRALGPGRGGECGSCAGYPAQGEPLDSKHGRSDAEIRYIRQQTAQAILDYEKRVGKVPGDWSVWATKELLPAKVRWQDQLPRLLRSAHQYTLGHTDVLYDRPSRRQSALGFGEGIAVLPRLASPTPEIMFIDDTSGSMHGNHGLVLSEALAILRATGLPLTFGACDAKMQTLERVSNLRDVDKLLKGGGGTDFRPIFEALKNTKPRPNILIIGTDGHGEAPPKPPIGTETLWLLFGKGSRKPYTGNIKQDISWGRFLNLTA